MKTLIDILEATGKLSKTEADALRSAWNNSGKSEEEFLKDKISEEDLFFAKSKFYGIPRREIEDDIKIPEGVLSIIPEDVAKHYKMVPLGVDGNVLEVGMVHPQDIKASDALKFILSNKHLSARIYLITESEFEKIVKKYSEISTKVEEALMEAEKETVFSNVEQEDTQDSLVEEAPINKIVNVIFRHAYEGKASDIHIEPMESYTRVRFRIDGVLHASLTLPKNIHASIVSKIKVLSRLKIDESRVPQDGRFRMKISGKPVDFRVSTFPTTEGEKVVLRLLDPSIGLKKIDELGFIGEQANVILRGLKKPYGMILVTGPTGSGKSTTLQSMLGMLNSEKVNIVSLEDPVEYYVDGVNQSQVRPEINYNFASGLRSILRQDPNIIMVGEIRDSETAALSVHAALTGHLVLSTLHTNDALGVIPRLMDMGVDSFLIPSSLDLVIAQRLVRRLCQNCKYAIEPRGRAKEILEENIKAMPDYLKKDLNLNNIKIYKAKGCTECGRKGTKGRIVIFEAFEMTNELKDIILDKKGEEEIEREIKRQGMVTMRQDGIVKAVNGIVSLEEVLQVTV